MFQSKMLMWGLFVVRPKREKSLLLYKRKKICHCGLLGKKKRNIRKIFSC